MKFNHLLKEIFKEKDYFYFEPGIYKNINNNYIFSVNLDYTDINHSNYQIQPEKNKLSIQVLNSNYLMIIAAIIFLLIYLIDWSIYLKKVGSHEVYFFTTTFPFLLFFHLYFILKNYLYKKNNFDTTNHIFRIVVCLFLIIGISMLILFLKK